MAITIIVFVLQMASESIAGVDYPALLGMKINELIIQGQLWRLVTPVFLHGSFLHIAFNMYALFVFGPGLERQYGHGRFLALYFLSGFAGNVFSFLFSPAPSLGASTAIFGLLGAEGVFFYRNREVYGKIGQRALINIITVAVINLVIGLSPGIDNWGHIGGLIGGTIFAWFGGPLLRVEGIYPALKLVDKRQTGEVILAGVGDFSLFAVLAAINIYFLGGFG
jgi:rhomboid protease GluP